MCTLELAVTTGHSMAILDAILEYADIRIAFLAHAGGDEIAVGDKPVCIFTTSVFLILPFFGRATERTVCKMGEGIDVVMLGASTGQREIVACKSPENKKEPKPEYPISTLSFFV